MADINFLSNKEQDKHNRKKGAREAKQEIQWSKAMQDKLSFDRTLESKSASRFGLGGKRDKANGKSSGLFSLFKKSQDKKDKPIAGIQGMAGIKHSRKKILKSIKEHKDEQAVLKNSGKRGELPRISVKLVQEIKKIFQQLFSKKENKAEVLIDYQQAVKHEKDGRRQTAMKQEDAKFAPPASAKSASWRRDEQDEASIATQKHKNTEEKKTADDTDKIADSAVDKKDDEKIIKTTGPLTNFPRQDSPRLSSGQAGQDEKKEKTQKTESPNILATNLMKGEVMSFFNWQKSIIFLLLNAIIALLIIGGVYGGLFLWEKQEKRVNNIWREKLEKLNRQIQQSEEGIDKILIFQKELRLAGSLLDKHIYWTNFFDFLEDNIIADVYLLDFAGTTNGTYSLSARASGFRAISEQVKVMRANKYVKEVSAIGGTLQENLKKDAIDQAGEVSFDLKLSIHPDMFRK